jgi:hypothetical protein
LAADAAAETLLIPLPDLQEAVAVVVLKLAHQTLAAQEQQDKEMQAVLVEQV